MNQDVYIQNQLTNAFYINEDRRNKPKESFLFVLKSLEDYCKQHVTIDFCDIGCATGDFLWVVSQTISAPNLILVGKDVNAEAIEIAKSRMSNVEFFVEDAFKSQEEQKYDIITCMGVIYLYEDPIEALNCILRQLKKNGRAYIFGHFNAYGFKVKYEYTTEKNGQTVTFSDYAHDMLHISEWLDFMNIKYKWHEFVLTSEIPFSQENPLRVWTRKTDDNKLLQVDGIDRVKNQYLLEICK